MELERLTGQALQDLINKMNAEEKFYQMQDLMLKNFFAGITTAPVNNDVIAEKLDALQENLKPTIKFFNETKETPTSKKVSKKTALQLAIEEQEKIIEMKAMKKAKGLF